MADDQTTPQQDSPFNPQTMALTPPAMAPPPQDSGVGVSQSDIQSLIGEKKDITKQAIADLSGIRSQQLTEAFRPIPHPGMPKLQNIPKPPQPDFRNVFKESMPGLMFTTLLGSLMSRKHGLGAMAAATGYMEGFHTGDQERMANERQKWNDQVDALIKQNNVEIEKHRAVLDDAHLSMQEKMARSHALAAAAGDVALIAGWKSGDANFVYGALDNKAKATQHLEDNRFKYGVEGGLSIQDVDFIARQSIAKGGVVPPSMFRGLQGSTDRRRVQARIRELAEEQGLKPEQLASIEQKFKAETAGLVAEERSGATLGANLEMVMRNAHAAIPKALEFSEKVARGSWVPINKLVQTSESNISDPNLKEFRVANLNLAELWARAMNPRGVMREEDRRLALEMLSTADSKETYKRVVNQLKSFLEREQQSVREFRAHAPMGSMGGGESGEKTPAEGGGWGKATVVQ